MPLEIDDRVGFIDEFYRKFGLLTWTLKWNLPFEKIGFRTYNMILLEKGSFKKDLNVLQGLSGMKVGHINDSFYRTNLFPRVELLRTKIELFRGKIVLKV